MGTEITRDPINSDEVLARFQDPAHGAVLAFWGVVRNHHEGRSVLSIDYHCYEEMALKELEAVREEVQDHFGLRLLHVVHRIGPVQVGEASLLVVASDAHRRPIFEGILQLVDELKRRVPIWKKEFGTDGSHWVEGARPPG